ncbi:MAG: Swt1 family HEPN domain-containing protein, partial [Chloroflexia bacterium]
MALSNNDRVGKALELLNAGLRPFVLREMQAVYRDQAIDEALSTLRSDQERRSAGRDPNRWDTSVLISVMLGRWNGVF